jgi:hypothetical protein
VSGALDAGFAVTFTGYLGDAPLMTIVDNTVATSDPEPVVITVEEDTPGSLGLTAEEVAEAFAEAIDDDESFTAVADGAWVIVTNVANGYAKPARNGTDSIGFLDFQVTQYGEVERDVGYIDGEIEISGFGEDLEAVTAHQRGSTIITHLRKGNPELSATITFKETTPEQLRSVLLSSGGAYIPDGDSAQELVGLGIDRQFTSTYAQARKLRMHPIRLSPSDRSEDWTMWKACPAVESLSFSGESTFVIPASFMIYPDPDKPRAIQYICVGDSSALDEEL